MNLVQGGVNWDNGKYGIWFGGFGNYQMAWHNAINIDPQFKAHLMVPFPHDGQGKAVQNFGNGTYALMAIKNAAPDRVKELLGILNYIAAPFGSQEAHLIKYGVKDVDHTFDAKGNPTLTQKGTQDVSVPWRNIEASPDYIYDATNPEFTTATHKELTDIYGIGQWSPVVGLYSATDFSKGAQLRQAVTDGVNAIMYGREPLSSYDALVQTWRQNGGDQIRAEYQQALQDAANK
jgi:putative aldouronate transport system substrate-binding protein